MKIQTFIIAIIIGLFGCTSNNKYTLSGNDKEKIEEEVEMVILSISDGWKNLDVNKAFKNSFCDSQEFNYIGIDGSFMSYDQFFTTAQGIFGSYKKAEFNINEKIIQVVSNDVVVISINYSGAFLSTESKLSFPNCGCTFVMNKIEDKWKVIHFHESIQESKFISSKIE